MKKIKTITHHEQCPIIISIKNPTTEEKKWVLFGTNVFLHEDNFGSDEEVIIVNEGLYSYQSILQDLSSKRISVGLLRIMTDVKANFAQKISFQKICNSMKSSFAEYISEYINPLQFQSDICETTCNLILDKENFISGTIKPNSKMVLSFYPKVSLQETEKNDLLKGKESFIFRITRNIVRKIQSFKIKILNLFKRNKHGK
jgi:hypothetical protein